MPAHTSPAMQRGPFLLNRTRGAPQERAQVPARHEFHNQNQPIAAGRDGTTDVHRVGATAACHCIELPHERPELISLGPEGLVARVS